MPELPEVETTRRGIEPYVAGKVLGNIIVRQPALRWPVEAPPELSGQTIERVTRRGKYILFHFATGTLLLHLGMSGSLRVLDPQAPLLMHDHVDLFIEGRVLRFNDPRRFGCMLYQPGDDPELHRLLKHLGCEPLENDFHGQYLHQKSRNRKVAVKNFIMDSKIVVGVGNIYAAEALFRAGIRPAIAAGRIPAYAYDSLAASIRLVLTDAIRQGGTTLRDFVGSDGNPGYFKQKLHVYGRDGQPCRVCDTSLKLQILGQRSSVYCPNCQTSQGFKPPKC